MKSLEYGSFKIYVDGEYVMTIRCDYGNVLDLVWPIHYNDPQADIEIVADTE